jgi:hypothetical protein
MSPPLWSLWFLERSVPWALTPFPSVSSVHSVVDAR